MRRIIIVGAVILALLGAMMAWAAPPRQANLFQLFVLQTREDMELLADEVLGEGERPELWTGNTDLDSGTVVVDLWFDNEQLADVIFGQADRPPAWFGATTTDLELLTRNIRHDLELSADAVLGDDRPPEWNGSSPIFTCDRTLQNLVRLLDEQYDVRPETGQNVLDYCAAVANEVENDLLRVVFDRDQFAEDTDIPQLALALRGDLERLANEVYGVNDRPATWVGNTDQGSPTLIGDAAADLEELADQILGNNVRPEEWASFISDSPAISYRNLRFNLELLADLYSGEEERPNGWQGEDPVERCEPIEQGLIFVMQRNFGFTVDQTLAESDDFCSLTVFAANDLAENPPQELVEQIAEQEGDRRFMGESNYAFSYLDVAALDYMGVMPAGTEFRAWYRNFNESTMMFVSGENFALWIDRRFTTLDEERFRSLPTREGVRPLAFCDAPWCNGPRPTPTPTGSGALLAVLDQATPAPTVDPLLQQQTPQPVEKTQVSFGSIRITYLLDRTDVGRVQVALEICADESQTACEPVTSVTDTTTGQPVPAISQFNGLNVYELPYGYTTQFRIEGATRFSNDIWVSDPTIRGGS